MSNPYQPLVDRLDELVPALEGNNLTDGQATELADLVRRLLFFTVNTLTTQAVVSPHLILPVEEPPVEAEKPAPGTD